MVNLLLGTDRTRGSFHIRQQRVLFTPGTSRGERAPSPRCSRAYVTVIIKDIMRFSRLQRTARIARPHKFLVTASSRFPLSHARTLNLVPSHLTKADCRLFFTQAPMFSTSQASPHRLFAYSTLPLLPFYTDFDRNFPWKLVYFNQRSKSTIRFTIR